MFVYVFVIFEILGTGCHIATLPSPSQSALPSKLHKLLFKHIRQVAQEIKPLELSRSLCLDHCAPMLHFWLPWAGQIPPTI